MSDGILFLRVAADRIGAPVPDRIAGKMPFRATNAAAFRHHAVPPQDRPPWDRESSLTADADNATNTVLTHLILALERDHLARFQAIAQ